MVFLSNQEVAIPPVNLSQTQVLEGVLKGLIDKYGILYDSMISLDRPVRVEVANDPNCPHQKIGTMCYQDFSVICVDAKFWLVAVGHICAPCPGDDEYKSDIIAVNLPLNSDIGQESLKRYFTDRVKQGKYFRNSLLIGTASGHMGHVFSGSFWRGMLEATSRIEIDDIAFKQSEAPITYKPTAIDAFLGGVEHLLASYNLCKPV